MKKAFTLVELLVVVVILVTLMGIVFRLSGIGRDQERRNTTLTRMQRLENCLSGYYAAFGSYPPVSLHANQDPFVKFDETTRRQEEGARISGSLQDNWESVNAACRAQPLAARFPFDPKYKKYIETVSRVMSERANSGDDRYKAYQARVNVLGPGFETLENVNDVDGWDVESYWQEVQIFQFGLMSYLLPRYLFMANGLRNNNGIGSLDECKQWTTNNRLSANQNTGELFPDWNDQLGGNGLNRQNLIQRIPSQAVTARWLPNLEGVVATTGTLKFYGINVSGGGNGPIDVNNPNIEIFKGSRSQYVLDAATVLDGWWNEFYYYSEPPYQSYRLWSAGSNGRTFPPWYPLENIENASDKRTAANWMADDIMFMSN